MSNAILIAAAVTGMAVGVVGIYGALKLFSRPGAPVDDSRAVLELRRLERLKLLLIGVMGIMVVGLSFLINDVSNHVDQVNDVRDNQDCMIGLLRTPSPYFATDAELRARGCPTSPPFTP